jgi:hypothetical protein
MHRQTQNPKQYSAGEIGKHNTVARELNLDCFIVCQRTVQYCKAVNADFDMVDEYLEETVRICMTV